MLVNSTSFELNKYTAKYLTDANIRDFDGCQKGFYILFNIL